METDEIKDIVSRIPSMSQKEFNDVLLEILDGEDGFLIATSDMYYDLAGLTKSK